MLNSEQVYFENVGQSFWIVSLYCLNEINALNSFCLFEKSMHRHTQVAHIWITTGRSRRCRNLLVTNLGGYCRDVLSGSWSPHLETTELNRVISDIAEQCLWGKEWQVGSEWVSWQVGFGSMETFGPGVPSRIKAEWGWMCHKKV